jgi:hypothetical protein
VSLPQHCRKKRWFGMQDGRIRVRWSEGWCRWNVSGEGAGLLDCVPAESRTEACKQDALQRLAAYLADREIKLKRVAPDQYEQANGELDRGAGGPSETEEAE